MRKTKTSKNEVRTLIVTQKDYDREIARTPKADALKPGSYHFQRATRFAKPEDIEKRNTKLTVSIRLDVDVVEFFKARAAGRNAAPYQTHINAALRAFMEGQGAIDLDARKLLGNETFVSALADRVRERI